MSTLQVAVVGCGVVAANHVAGHRSVPGVEVVACVDTDAVKARAFADRHGIPHVVADPVDLPALGVTAVSICTPHPTHEALVVTAAGLGLHVLCEKPIATTVAAAERMVTACAEAGVTLGVLFQRQFSPAARRIRAAVEDGVLGTPVLGHVQVLLHRDSSYYEADAWRGTWATDGGGVLMTQAIHQLDLLLWFMGDVAEVSARHATFVHGASIEVEDTLVATLHLTSGGLATFAASTAQTPGLGNRVQVSGDRGGTVSLLEYPEGAEAVNDVWAVAGEAAVLDPFGPELQPDPSLPDINAHLAPLHALQIADFAAAVREGRRPAVTGEDALRSLRVVAAIYASAAAGAPVRPDRERTTA